MKDLEAAKLRDLESELISLALTNELLKSYKHLVKTTEHNHFLEAYGEMRGLRIAIDVSCYRHGETRYMKIADWLINRGFKNGW